MRPVVEDYTYFDYNASSPLQPSVLEAIAHASRFAGNPSSVHQPGQQAKHLLTKSRHVLKNFLQSQSARVIFTSGATESNAWILSHTWDAVYTSPLEHPSVLLNRKHTVCPVDNQGSINLSELEDMLCQDTRTHKCLCVQWANGDTGIIQNIKEIANIAHKHNTFVHTDATQAFGRIPLHFDESGVDSMSLSAHKCGGPKGVGAIVFKETGFFPQWTQGGKQEFGLRAGTENLPGIAGFSAVCHTINWAQIDHLRTLHNDFEKRIESLCPNACIALQYQNRLPNTSLIHMPHVQAATQIIQCDLARIAISAGPACSSGQEKSMKSLLALGYSEEVAQESVRISSGWSTKPEDFDRLYEQWIQIWRAAKK
ncbi:MAG: cysteine desulfurase family protein [Alphaproteobacteria bacterium]|nr:cysteine desulfurase family protein [Alphaproteobacteria bacterium]